jgi:hypothetical protein
MLCLTFTSPTDSHAADTVYRAESVAVGTFGVMVRERGAPRPLMVATVEPDGGQTLFIVTIPRPGGEPVRITYQDICIEEI